MSIKLVQIIRFDPTLSIVEKIEHLEPMGEAFAQISQNEILNSSVSKRNLSMQFYQVCSLRFAKLREKPKYIEMLKKWMK